MSELEAKLRQLRRYWLLEQMMRRFTRVAPVALGLSLLLALLDYAVPAISLPFAAYGLITLWAFLFPLLRSWEKGATLAATAAEFDRRCDTGDRLITAWDLERGREAPAGGGSASALREAALRECRAALAGREFPPDLIRKPHPRRWVLVALLLVATPLVLTLPEWNRLTAGKAQPQDLAQAEVNAEIARGLRQASAELEALEQSERDRQAVQALRDAADRLEAAEAVRARELREQALRELSAVEAAVRGALGRGQQASLSSSELSQISEALRGVEDFAEAGRQMARGELAEAGEELDRALRNLRADPQARQKKLEQVSRGLAQSSVNSSQSRSADPRQGQESPMFRDLMRQNQGSAMQALQELARQLQQQQNRRRTGTARQREGQGTATDRLRQLQRQLRDLKNQARGEQMMMVSDNPDSPRDPGGEEGEQREGFAVNNAPGQSDRDSMVMMVPSPGFATSRNTQQDFGTADPLDPENPMELPEPDDAAGVRVDPSLSEEGKSLQSLSLAREDFSSAGLEYRRLYEQAQPAMEEAIDREEVELEDRELVRRYFEAIRPR